jgi:vitamin B12 transporter
MRTFTIAVAALLAVAPTDLTAQEQPDTFRLRELVVTATRLPTPVAEAPGSITVVTGAQMRERGQRFVADALRSVPGVSVTHSAGPGSLTAVFLRGGESDYVQVLVDGVQVNDPGGSFDWSHLRADDIERIEIVRGPASVLYGSDAVAGVVQVFTRSGGAPRLETGLSSARGAKRGAADRGDFDTHALDASLTGATTAGGVAIQYGASVVHARSNGLFAYNSDYRNTAGGIRARLMHERGDIAFTTRFTDRIYHYPTSGSGAVIDPNQFALGDTRSFGLDAGVRLLPALELRALAALHAASTRSDDPADDASDGTFWSTADQQRRSIDARLNLTLPYTAVLTVGAEREWQEAQTAYESTSEFGTFTDETDDARTAMGWYVQLHGTPLRRIAVTVGGRVDDSETFGTFHTGRAALSVQPTKSSRVHIAAGTAFKEPTFFENFATGFTRGNAALQPEQSRSVEAGVEQSFGSGALTLSGTAFQQRFRNLIQYTAAPAPDEPNYHNVGAARARGAEVGLVTSHAATTMSVSYTYTSTRVTDAGLGEDVAFRAGSRLLRRPEHTGVIDITARITPDARALIGARFVGQREDLDFTDPAEWAGIRTTLAGYTVVDAGVVWTLRLGGSAVDLNAGVRNVLDADYHEIYNFPTAGRVVHVGIRAGVAL